MSTSGYEYYLPAEEREVLSNNVINFAGMAAPNRDVVGVLVPYDAPESNIARSEEQRVFTAIGEDYDFRIGMAPHEDRSVFLLTVDTNRGIIAHGKRMVHARNEVVLADNPLEQGLTGIEPIDDRLTATDPEEYMTLAGMLSEANLSIDGLRSVVNVATNFRMTKARTPEGGKLPYSSLSYVNVFRYATQPEQDARAISAYLNRNAKLSLGRIRVELENIGNRPLHLPQTAGAGYDLNYEAVLIPDSRRNKAIFRGLGLVANVPLVKLR